nr:unnamed protein product [Spirometra erinaceieuropaei]
MFCSSRAAIFAVRHCCHSFEQEIFVISTALQTSDEVTGLNYSPSPNENLLPGSNDAGAQPNSQSAAGLGPIKRKRGRPRKYTLGPFPPQVLKTDVDGSTRLSLPLNYSNCDPFSLPTGQSTANDLKVKEAYLQNTDASANLKKMKSKQTVPRYLAHLGGITNGHAVTGEPNTPETFPLDNAGKVDETLALAAAMPLAAGVGGTPFAFPTALPQHSSGLSLSTSNSQESYHSSKYTKSSVGSSYAGFGFPASTAVAISSLNGQKASSQQVGSHPFSVSRVSSPSAAAVAASNSLFLDSNSACGNNAFLVAATSVPPAVPTAAASVAALAACETNLISRLLPQAEAAVCAARAAGLCGPHAWTPDMVAAFITTLPGCQSLAPVFAENEIDGPALLCLEQHDLMSVLKLKLGPAVKIFGAIRALRRSMMSIPYSDLSEDRASAIAAASSCFPVNKTQPSAPRKSQLSNCASPQLPTFSIKRLTTNSSIGEPNSADSTLRPQDVSMPLTNGVQPLTPPAADS